MTEWFDSHCHVDEEKFNEDRDTVLARMREHGITRFAVIGSDMETSRHAIAFAKQHLGAVAAGGIHPHEAKGFREEDCEEIARWWATGEIRAIGEIGLDYYYDFSPRDVQKAVCIRQMELAYELGAPVVYHIRDAHGEMLEIMKSMKQKLTGGIIHCFSGSAEMAKEYLKAGFYLGVTGIVTFKNARKVVELVDMIPLDRLLIETDAPYLAPVPHRGERNDSSLLPAVCEAIAARRGLTPQEVADLTRENAKRLFL